MGVLLNVPNSAMRVGLIGLRRGHIDCPQQNSPPKKLLRRSKMRRVVLLALLALALPTAALANSVDFDLNGGTMTVGSSSVSISTFVSGIGLCNPICPATPTPATGIVSISLPTFSTSASGNFGAGGNINISSGSYLFNGSFTSGTWTVVAVTLSGKIQTEYVFTGVASGLLWVNGVATQTTVDIVSGQSVLSLAG